MFGLVAGGLINFFTFISLIFYIYKRVSIDSLEKIILFTKFEFLIYFFIISCYIVVHFIMNTGYNITYKALLSYFLPLLSLVNYCSFRQNFYQKLRIKNLLLPMNVNTL